MSSSTDPTEGPAPTGAPHFHVARDAYFSLSKQRPLIPAEKGRKCPQCREVAWGDSRWCWNCEFDFDRAECDRFHPTKLLFVSVLTNVALAAAVVCLLTRR